MIPRPAHIEDYLITVRMGQWFGWSDSKNKIYANLIVHDGGTKPSESDCTNGLKVLQDAWDLENDSYRSKRKEEYPDIGDQLDDLYKKGAFSDEMAAKIKTVKDKYPKS
jgi:hypothetical protein|tara:strand:- start:57 stop:383 length:327 start_codon:yes stop_codon:yes gene_type:complete